MTVTTAPFVISLVLTATLCEFALASEESPTIEVFTDAGSQVVGGADNTTVYVIDRIAHLQHELSKDLPGHPDTAKRLALRRFQGMDARLSSALENAAKGLVRAQQYGIDRYPAIVFAGEAIVYGVTDINAATRVYQTWLEEGDQQ